MRIINDIFFANVSGKHNDNHYLDLYLPDSYGLSKKDVGHSYVQENTGSIDLEVNFTESDSTSDHVRLCTGEKQDSIYCQKNTELSSVEFTENTRGHIVKPSDNAKAADVPLVIFVHGGGWRRGGRQAWTHYLYFDVNFLVVLLSLLVGTYTNVGKALASSGIACAVISYPLTEAGVICLLAELCLSYIQSCFAVFLACVPVAAIVFVNFCFFLSSGGAWFTQLQGQNTLNVKAYILIIMFVTNILTTVLLSVKRREFRLKLHHIKLLWFCLAAGNLAIYAACENKLIFSVLLSFLVNQSIILKVRLSRCGGCYEDQTKVLAKAVRWARTERKGGVMFDTGRLYLMGHSAGGHLVSLTALDDDILATEGCSHKDIKGVVSLSGVYDLTCLCGPFLRPLYLSPTFGHSHATWLRASPSHLMSGKPLKENDTRPKFLLLDAERDLFLKEQSWRFSEILQEADVDSRHIEIVGTNHFTILTNLRKRFTGNDKSVISHISDFVHS